MQGQAVQLSRVRLLIGQLIRAAGLLVLAVALAGCQTVANSPRTPLYEPIKLSSTGHAKAAKSARAAKARAAKARAAKARAARAARSARAEATPEKPVKPAATNRPALGLKLLNDYSRTVLFQDRLSGLCDVTKTEQVNADSWRASCAKGDAFVVKVYPDGFMSTTRSDSKR